MRNFEYKYFSVYYLITLFFISMLTNFALSYIDSSVLNEEVLTLGNFIFTTYSLVYIMKAIVVIYFGTFISLNKNEFIVGNNLLLKYAMTVIVFISILFLIGIETMSLYFILLNLTRFIVLFITIKTSGKM